MTKLIFVRQNNLVVDTPYSKEQLMKIWHSVDMVTWGGNWKYYCDKCDIHFWAKKYLKEHKEQIHSL